ncbi:MAG TPA: polysaccharide deacetylase family protein [Thermoanaerobaculia bacterium]|nr:polysaccharide deacetylase family protein [Thermoanaerobaculia bacterium]
MTARRALLATILVLFSLASYATPKRSSEDGRPVATVLCYHIVESPADPRMEVSRETFRQHLRYLEMTGYNIIPLRHLYEYVSGKRASIPKNAVVITIDDGWRSTYTEAFPELKKRNFPFTVFIYPNIIGNTANALTWKQIREMSNAGGDMESHSLSHPYLSRKRHRGLDDTTYAQWLAHEMAESKRRLEKETGKTVQFLAYPYGDYDQGVADAAEAAGYTAALTCEFGRVKAGSDPFRMKRVVIDKRMDFAAFRHYLGTTPMQLAEITPAPALPADPSATVISAKIPNFKSVDPKSVGMALLSLGSAIPYSYDASTGSVSLIVKDALSSIQGRYHRAIVWATDAKTGKRVEASWVLRLPDPNAPPAVPAAAPAQTALPPVVPAGAQASAVHATGGIPK